MLVEQDPLGAFMRYPPVRVGGAASGPLAGLRLAVKDIYDVRDYPTGCGTPAKLEEAGIAEDNAPAVQALLDAGAAFVGKTISDEMAFSLQGQNAHYGTPVNAAAPDRIPGGSSSGSASAVSGGLADLALGSDTGGSVRAPASYCGLFGIRPTHGRIGLSGCMPLAPSYDTVGWFAGDAAAFIAAGEVLLGEDSAALPGGQPAILTDAVALMVDDATRDALASAVFLAEAILGEFGSGLIAGSSRFPQGLDDWLMVFRTTQAHEIWQNHGGWIESRRPEFGPGVRERFEWARRVSADREAVARAWALHGEIREHVRAIAAERLLILPTVPAIAPLCTTPVAELEIYRNRALSILCIAGIAGLPQVTMPLARHEGCPIGLSIIGPQGSDLALIRLAGEIASAEVK